MINGSGELLFFRQREGPWLPTLRLLHKCKLILILLLITGFFLENLNILKRRIFNCLDPFFLPKQQVDKGAIRFVLSGANIMCPGLTSKGAQMTPVPKGTVVVSF